MESTLPDIFITNTDYERLTSLVMNVRTAAASHLEEELGRATVVSEEKLPFPVVVMNSTVRFRDLESGKESEVTLVYPEKANVDTGRISILAPIGIALIGLRLNEEIMWPMPNGQTRKLEVISIAPAKD